jgi:hypothetical protein
MVAGGQGGCVSEAANNLSRTSQEAPCSNAKTAGEAPKRNHARAKHKVATSVLHVLVKSFICM